MCLLQRTRRKWIIDRQTGYIAEELKEDLGDWIVRQLARNIPWHEKEAQALIDECDLTVPQLRVEWQTQHKMQTSVHQCMYGHPFALGLPSGHRPFILLMLIFHFVDTGKLLENYLNEISSWQSQLYHCNQEFARVLAQFTKEDDTPENWSCIAHLEKVKADFQESVNDLYYDLGLVK